MSSTLQDTYFTLQQTSMGMYKEKGSKFIAYAMPVKSEEAVKEKIAEIKKEHAKARHHCYAYRLNEDKFRTNDDGEPINTAGIPILRQIDAFQLSNVLIVVVRYFGGKLLGKGGLINAYQTAAKEALESATIVEKTIDHVYGLSFEYPMMNDVMRIIKINELDIITQHFASSCEIKLSIRKSKTQDILPLFEGKKVNITLLQDV